MGTPQFAVPSLDILIKNGHEIISVVTVPDKPKGRGQKVGISDVKQYALEHNLPVLQPVKLKDENFLNELRALQPDLIIVVAFRILPSVIFDIPKHGIFNLHGSLLPKYRGAAPINWAIINGDKETGVTTFFLKEKVDTGNIILQAKLEIGENDTFGEIYEKLSGIGANLVLETVREIENSNVKVMEQKEEHASPAPKIFKEDCRIDWSKSVEKIHNLVRGLSPHPAAWTTFQDKVLKIYTTLKTSEKFSGEPGSLIKEGRKLFVNTNDYLLEILELQLEGKKRMKTIDFLNGVEIGNESKLI
ncbi:MAG: methionyl-tRNA formyltransferase [Bacteroidetes bacterium]|nr:methionyl-tRNA formyltransferase [Bacteroidota bacterium]